MVLDGAGCLYLTLRQIEEPLSPFQAEGRRFSPYFSPPAFPALGTHVKHLKLNSANALCLLC